MKIEAFIIAWNEAETIHLTIKHYQKYCKRITIFDNYSTDETPEIARKAGCIVKQFGVKGQLNDHEYIKLKNQCWKGSDCDYVIVCDADEILDLSSFTHISRETIIRTYGWNVFSPRMPINDWSEITRGLPDKNYSKAVMFNPHAIMDINYVYGCHVAGPKGKIVLSEAIYPLFHYRNVGGWERLCARHAQYRERLAPINKKWDLGIHYTYDDERRVKEWEDQFKRSQTFSQGFISPSSALTIP